ncbi:hypothetical protein PG911_08035 [Tenacibaculum ovolyticum]|uniref:hypothetical protein n=1 Tax=Tenacibaculum ovolyticum TaxID=104270 RepID=UPI0022F3A71F|nr:hypothetical protein [Tenacibaculum ovolyticum]WBX78191.1 hypothetical protein PG911_08035 [Tenacibaculum ovolyticum]
MMIKKNIKMILGFLFILIFIQKCTTINITSASIFKKKEYETYNYLKDGVNSEKFQLERISENAYNLIGYDEIGNYFIVYGDEKITKINSVGEEQFKIDRLGNVSYANFGSYVFTDSEIYDLTQEKIKVTSLNKIIDFSNKELNKEEFFKLMETYYSKASHVIYANVETFSAKNYKVYLKIENEWLGIYISQNKSTGINFYPTGEIVKKYPEKFKKLLFLKNTVDNVYSTRSSGNEGFSSVPDPVILTKEDDLEYPKYKEIKTSFYQKEKTYGTIAYTSIPVSFIGTSYLKLEINKEVFKFKEKGIKSIGVLSSPKHYLSYYVLPEPFINKSQVSFLKLFYPTNIGASGSKGLYIIKPKK